MCYYVSGFRDNSESAWKMKIFHFIAIKNISMYHKSTTVIEI